MSAITADTTTPLIPGPTGERLEDQIKWYNDKSSKAQKRYKHIKVVEIVAASLIPFVAAVHIPDRFPITKAAMGPITALLGVLITILEGVLQLYQYQQIWLTYRAGCEAMKHEKFLYLAKAGDYAKEGDRLGLLAERIEAIGAQENIKWSSLQQQAGKGKGSPGDESKIEHV